MTAIIIAAQRKRGCIHVAGDSAMYLRDQTVVAFGSKFLTVPHWPGVITSTGNSAIVPHVGWTLAQLFSTFDELVAGVSDALPRLVEDYVALQERHGIRSGADLYFVGISAERGPEAYAIKTDDELPPGTTREEAEASEHWAPPFTLLKLPDLVMTPVPTDQVVPANYEGIDLDDDPEQVTWSLRKILEMQRRMTLPEGIGGIGGFGQLATVSADGVTQRLLQRWPDQLGTPLRPPLIDWDEWHRDNPKPGAPMSRVKRDMLARKTGKLRLVRQ
jgi:hypothetical protein